MRIIGWRYICLFRDPVTRICLWVIKIPIFVLVKPIFEPPSPDPPWLLGEGIRPELTHDLQVLATIDALAQTLSEGPQKALLESVQGQFDALKLPEGMKVLSQRDLQETSAKG
ncbi:hypothetical protein [Pseudoxanthomonas putridarboris]|uniref:Uncharacterized protein n=1 Tax=Pseudoxanthomonas putridarboris TaxID=752605 RepID=A0ABU9J391_9GAMM